MIRTGRRYLGVVNRKGSPEHDLQVGCVNWFRYQYPNLSPLLFSVPNGGSRNKIEAINLKMEGATPGVSDLIFLSPVNGVLLIEMKTPVGRQTPEQRLWEKTVETYGYKYVVIRTFEEFVDTIRKHLNT